MTPQPDNHVEEDIPVYLANGLSPDHRRAFESHTASCPQCAAALEEAKSLESQMTTLFTPARPAEGFEDRIIQKFRKSGIHTNRPMIHPMVRKVGGAVAAAVVLGAIGVTVSNGISGSSFLASPLARNSALSNARTANNLKQIGLAMQVYGHDFDSHRGNLFDRARVSDQNAVLQESATATSAAEPRQAAPSHDVLRFPTDWPAQSTPLAGARASRGENEVLRRAEGADKSIGGSDNIVLGKKVVTENENGRNLNRGRDGLGLEKDKSEAKQELFFKPATDLKLRGFGEQDEKLKELGDAEGKQVALGTTIAGRQVAESNQLFQNANRPGVVPKIYDVKDLAAQVPDFKEGPAFALDTGASPSTQPASPRKVIRNGTLQFEVDRFDDALMRVTKLVGEQGGYVATTDSDKLPNGKTRGTITLRVPPEHLDSLVLMLRGIGDLKSQKIGAEDVTKHYTDLESQLRAARAMQDRLLEIIKTGKGQIKDLLEAEKQLGVWREKIEQIEGEKRYIDNVVALATLSVELTERDIRTPATASEVEQVSMSLETEKVDEAYEKARAAIESAKGRILQSELKQFDAGQFGATIQATVPPDAAEQLIARLRQLDGRIAHFERQNKRTTRPGEGPITGLTNLHREDAVISMQIYNLANIAPRRTTTVVLATDTVDAAYQKALDQIRSAGGRVVTSALFKPDAQQQTADLDFQVPTEKSATVEDALRALGEVMRNDSAENPDTANVTEAKRGFRLHLVSTASVSPRETQDAQLVAADVPSAFNQILAAVTSAGGRVLQSDLKEQDPRDVTANLSFELPRSSLATVNLAVTKAAQQLSRNVTRSNDTQNTLDSKLRLTYAIASADRLPARQNVTIREEVTDVEKSVDDLTNAANSAGGRRVGGGDISQDSSGHVTAQIIVEVPADKAPTLLDQLEHTGNRRGKQVSYNPQIPDGPLARARIDVTFSNSAATLGGEESTWDAIRRGLATSALGLRWSLQMLIIGLCFVAPWALVIWATWKLTRRRKPIPAASTT